MGAGIDAGASSGFGYVLAIPEERGSGLGVTPLPCQPRAAGPAHPHIRLP